MKITILTLFPEMFDSYLNTSIIKRAIAKGLVDYQIINIRDYTKNKYNRVDDYPTGGGAGLIMQCQPVIDALKSVDRENAKVMLTSPRGKTFTQERDYYIPTLPANRCFLRVRKQRMGANRDNENNLFRDV